ncbi:uncharacterized protein LOC130943426 isoform X2 [Arachis stenosperma]|uniref:uncharacterized protein LOC130943426 isoform X2 n=1 Tax=Arachis stenosperma TaxID=217475 RepID=UPI0025ABADB8|nr:uncharacterized protein LOC130943426 isoform X2 [Arachis stenosperma]
MRFALLNLLYFLLLFNNSLNLNSQFSCVPFNLLFLRSLYLYICNDLVFKLIHARVVWELNDDLEKTSILFEQAIQATFGIGLKKQKDFETKNEKLMSRSFGITKKYHSSKVEKQ